MHPSIVASPSSCCCCWIVPADMHTTMGIKRRHTPACECIVLYTYSFYTIQYEYMVLSVSPIFMCRSSVLKNHNNNIIVFYPRLHRIHSAACMSITLPSTPDLRFLVLRGNILERVKIAYTEASLYFRRYEILQNVVSHLVTFLMQLTKRSLKLLLSWFFIPSCNALHGCPSPANTIQLVVPVYLIEAV